MDFEWDEAKRLATIAERGIDFLDAPLLFDGRVRIVTTGRARDEEKRRYRAAFGG